MREWYIFSFLLVFAVYWASNLFLWYPWSYDPMLGMILMLTVSPIAWGYTVYLSLLTIPKENLYKSAFRVALLFLITAIVLDYIFFGMIRNAWEQLYHPTTFYGYGFLLALPFLIAWIFKNPILTRKRVVTIAYQFRALGVGLLCMSVLILIILLDLNI